jgi:hypothetical protein
MAKSNNVVSIKFCVNLGKSATETTQRLCEAFGEHSLSRIAVFEWHSRFMVGRVSLEDDKHSGQRSTSKKTKNVEKIQELITKTVAEQSISLQTPLGSVMEFARRP